MNIVHRRPTSRSRRAASTPIATCFRRSPSARLLSHTEFNNDGGTRSRHSRLAAWRSVERRSTIKTPLRQLPGQCARPPLIPTSPTFGKAAGACLPLLLLVATGASVQVQAQAACIQLWQPNVKRHEHEPRVLQRAYSRISSSPTSIWSSLRGPANGTTTNLPRDVVTSLTNGYVDAMLDFAEANNLLPACTTFLGEQLAPSSPPGPTIC